MEKKPSNKPALISEKIMKDYLKIVEDTIRGCHLDISIYVTIANDQYEFTVRRNVEKSSKTIEPKFTISKDKIILLKNNRVKIDLKPVNDKIIPAVDHIYDAELNLSRMSALRGIAAVLDQERCNYETRLSTELNSRRLEISFNTKNGLYKAIEKYINTIIEKVNRIFSEYDSIEIICSKIDFGIGIELEAIYDGSIIYHLLQWDQLSLSNIKKSIFQIILLSFDTIDDWRIINEISTSINELEGGELDRYLKEEGILQCETLNETVALRYSKIIEYLVKNEFHLPVIISGKIDNNIWSISVVADNGYDNDAKDITPSFKIIPGLIEKVSDDKHYFDLNPVSTYILKRIGRIFKWGFDDNFRNALSLAIEGEENKFVQILNDKFTSIEKSNSNEGGENMKEKSITTKNEDINPLDRDLTELASRAPIIVIRQYLPELMENLNAIKDKLFKIRPVKIDHDKKIVKIRISSTDKMKNDSFDLVILFDYEKLFILNIHDTIKKEVLPYIHVYQVEYFWNKFDKVFIDCIGTAIIEYSNPYIVFGSDYGYGDSNKLIYKDFMIKSLFDSLRVGEENRKMVLDQIKEANWFKINTCLIGDNIYEFGKNCFEAYASITGLVVALIKDYIIVHALSPLPDNIKALLESSTLSFKCNTDIPMIPDISLNIEHTTIDIPSIRINPIPNHILYSDKHFKTKYEDALNLEMIKIMRNLKSMDR